MKILTAIVGLFFGACIGFLYLVSYAFQISYDEACVYVNLWFQAIVLLLSALFVVVATTYKLFKHPSVGQGLKTVGSMLYFGLYGWGGKLLYDHYGTISESAAFNLCKNELMQMSRQMLQYFDLAQTSKNLWMGYYCVNLLIFVVFYLMLLFLNYKMGRNELKQRTSKVENVK